LTGNDITGMADKASSWANPVPEIDPLEVQQHAAVVATGRSDFPKVLHIVELLEPRRENASSLAAEGIVIWRT
jgi:malic enzyme